MCACRWRKIKAIRPEEVTRLLRDLSKTGALTAHEKAAVSKGSFREPEWISQARQSVWGLPPNVNQQQILDALSQMMAAHRSAIDTARNVSAALKGEAHGTAEDLGNLLASATKDVPAIEASVNEWFDTVMDRTTEIFTFWTRVFTL